MFPLFKMEFHAPLPTNKILKNIIVSLSIDLEASKQPTLKKHFIQEQFIDLVKDGNAKRIFSPMSYNHF